MKSHIFTLHLVLLSLSVSPCFGGGWEMFYSQDFDQLSDEMKTASDKLPQWEAGSASGVVFDGKTKSTGKFLVASSAWTSFNQGPILNLDLTAVPHDRVRVSFDLYAFGEWRGVQEPLGGPQHRLMFFDKQATPPFSFDTCFATNPEFAQAWPDRNPNRNTGGKGAVAINVDKSGRFDEAHLWKVQFEYPSSSSELRFAILCGAASGSGSGMPEFGIDNVKVSFHSTAAEINATDRPEEMQIAFANHPASSGTPIDFAVENTGRVSLAVFEKNSGRLLRTLLSGEHLKSGEHRVHWDGLDNHGEQVPQGEYEWRLIDSPGLTARYITTIGINPPGGENPVPNQSWVGDHLGGGIVDVDESGVYIGSPATEGGRMILKVNSQSTAVEWSRPQFYQSGRLTKAATSGKHLFMIHPNGKLRRVNKNNGKVEAEWQVGIEDFAPSDIDADGDCLVAVYPERGTVRWFSSADGTTIADKKLTQATCIAVIENSPSGAAFVSVGSDVYRVSPASKPKRVLPLSGEVTAMDFDSGRQELWVVVDGHQVLCIDQSMNLVKKYGDRPRPWGRYDPTQFAGIYDIAADLQGGFFVGEPTRAPRRIAHIARDGSVFSEWFGGMSFYIGGVFDPEDHTRLLGVAPEGSLNVYRIDYQTGTWNIEACYQTGRLGDSMFPFTSAYRVVKRGGETYLYAREIPSVIRLDAERGKAVPVAIAGTVRNRGRSFSQFAGTGRDGYPKPWVAAAEHWGFNDLSQAPKHYSWADTDGNGEFDPQEFSFFPNINEGLHGGGDFLPNGDFIGRSGMNNQNAFVKLPVSGWEGPSNAAPRWDFNMLQSVGRITAESHGFGSVRDLFVAKDGSIAATYQAGVMIREHGQYEGGSWPECAVKGCRLLKFNDQFQPKFCVGRQSKHKGEVNTGKFYYPMRVGEGPNNSVIVNDQTKQPAQVWTSDGLYVGGLFDNREDDGLPKGFYSVHGDDNQGCTVVMTPEGRTYWLMPYQGHNRLYEITGWSDWERQTGMVSLQTPSRKPAAIGTGLHARYIKGNETVLEEIEPPIYYEPFGAERHQGKVSPHYQVEWTGYLEAPLTDRFQFRTLLGANEQIAIWIDGRLIHSAGLNDNKSEQVDLIAGHRHHIRIEYINPDGRAELKLLWSSRVLDLSRIPSTYFYAKREVGND